MTESNQVHPDDIRRLQGEVSDIKELMGQLTTAVTRLTVLEERQQNMSGLTAKILDQVEQIRNAQHQTELRFATQGDLQSRIAALELKAREDHLEYQKDKAALAASVKALKLFIGVSWVVFVFAVGTAIKLYGGA